MTWEEWKANNDRLLHAIAWKYAKYDRDELYQRLSIATWKAFDFYGEDAPRMMNLVIKNAVRSYFRILRTGKRFSELEDEESPYEYDPGQPEEEYYDYWERVFAVAHQTDNLLAARILRVFVNPELPFIFAEQREGKLTWNLIYRMLGITRRNCNVALAKLRADLQRFKINPPDV